MSLNFECDICDSAFCLCIDCCPDTPDLSECHECDQRERRNTCTRCHRKCYKCGVVSICGRHKNECVSCNNKWYCGGCYSKHTCTSVVTSDLMSVRINKLHLYINKYRQSSARRKRLRSNM